ncbi:MAG TPA: tetratricopeptide repeat protein [Chthoniobacterales bacterium]|nr:tetratricopeptide repeat protein [Chthoniobacterales bacterium]
MNRGNFFDELRRRNVYRAAAAYSVVAWLLIQIATQVFPFFNIPAWAVRFVVVLLLLGFPLAMAIAWIFEWTSEGLKRTGEVPPAESVRRGAGRKWDFLIIGALLVVIGVLVWQRFSPAREKSIAVLPLENFSADKENAFLADGIQDDLLTNLAKIKDLKVISRTSVMKYRNPEGRNIQEIGKALDAANVVEGSVRRVGDRIAVNVQLIDTRTDRHIWAERYDRKIADAVGIEGELAMEIAEALRATLTPEEKIRVEQKPTQNADAFVLYLRALPYEQGPDTLLQDYKRAVQLYSEAIALDPNFALAHARLASTYAEIFHFHEPLDSWKTKARNAAETALRLQSNLAEAHFALGQCIYWIDENYEGALAEFAIAQRLSPSNANVGLLVAAINRRQGRWEECLAAFERIQRLDPENPNIVRNLVFTNSALRRWPEAARAAQRLRAMAPDSLVARIQVAYIDFQWKGDIKAPRAVFGQTPPGEDPDGIVTACNWDGAMLGRDFARAQQVLAASPLPEISYLNGGLTPKSFLAGCTALALGDSELAQKNFEAARKVFESAVTESPTAAERHANLGLCYAFMGRKEDAIRAGRRAVELKPESKDAYDGAIMNCCLALIYARVGENDLAVPLLERLLRTPGAVDSVNYSITVNDLKFRWEWDPLRSDPAFQKLVSN